MAQQTTPIRRIIFGTHSGPNVIVRKSPQITISKPIERMLAQPSWSVKSLLPQANATEKGTITREKLHHLLKLSALPAPKNGAEERQMLRTLESQIHFVKEIQKIDTTGIEPLVAIRDETDEAIRAQMIGLSTLQPYLDNEMKVGNNGTIRRQKPTEMIKDSGWNPFEMGGGKETRKKGKFFFVKKQKEQTGNNAQPKT